ADAFVTKVAADGRSAVFTAYLGGMSPDQANAVAVGLDGTVYVGGTTSSGNFPVTASAYQPSSGGLVGPDGFFLRLNATGSAILGATYYGGSGSDAGNAVAVDAL